MTLSYQVRWGSDADWEDPVTLGPGQCQYHWCELDQWGCAPTPEIRFWTGIGRRRTEMTYSLDFYAGNYQNQGKPYAFRVFTDNLGEDYLDLNAAD